MDITVFASVMQVAPVFRDKGYSVSEFLQEFSNGDEDKELEIVNILDHLDLIQREYRRREWPHSSGTIYYWIFDYDTE